MQKPNIYKILPWVCLFLRLGLAVFFIYGGVIKLLDPKGFAKLLSQYGLVPEELLPIVAVGLPLLETAAGVGLIFNVKGSLAVITGLLGLFVAVLWYGVLNDMIIDCGCFGAGEIATLDGLRRAFYRDLILLGVAASLFAAGCLNPGICLPAWNRILNRRIKNGEES
ncbi:MAG TPA: MauE/DoxX family redox-associated membrane protein [Syntrophorhabdaceae bacterium]|jgi:uncharacterized membrane protein YphA (DoxX/SURF4 family)